jgi:hypothetical protein
VQTGQAQLFGVTALVIFLPFSGGFYCSLAAGCAQSNGAGLQDEMSAGRYLLLQKTICICLLTLQGVMAIIFASSLLMFPSHHHAVFAQQKSDPGQVVYDVIKDMPGIGAAFVESCQALLGPKTPGALSLKRALMPSLIIAWEHSLLYFVLILFFAFFYSSIILPVRDMSENLRRSGRAIQHVSPGRPTAEFLEKTLNRLLSLVLLRWLSLLLLPIHVEQWTQVTTLQGLGSTSLIILVGVAIDTQRQILTHALSARYQAQRAVQDLRQEGTLNAYSFSGRSGRWQRHSVQEALRQAKSCPSFFRRYFA